MKFENFGVWLGAAALIIAILLLFSYASKRLNAPEEAVSRFCAEDSQNEGGLACITIIPPGQEEQALFIAPEPVNPAPGSKFNIRMGLTIPDFRPSVIDTAMLYLQDSRGNTINSWDFRLSELAMYQYGGGSITITTSMTAPSTPGDYSLHFFISAPGRPAYIEKTTFKVGGTECPANYCDLWTLVYAVNGGVVRQRQCYAYGAAPTCGITIKWEYKTTCDSGYHCKGYTSRICDVIGTCEVDAPGCSNECQPAGLRECVGGAAFRVCGNYDSDSCLEWQTTSCEGTQYCLNGVCAGGGGGCATNAECNDGNKCTDDVCEAGACKNTPKDCGAQQCNPDTGECVQVVACTDAVDCADKPGYTKDCVNNQCEYAEDVTLCRAYQTLNAAATTAADKCKLNLDNLFTWEGVRAFSRDYAVEIGASAVILILMISVASVMIGRRGR